MGCNVRKEMCAVHSYLLDWETKKLKGIKKHEGCNNRNRKG